MEIDEYYNEIMMSYLNGNINDCRNIIKNMKTRDIFEMINVFLDNFDHEEIERFVRSMTWLD